MWWNCECTAHWDFLHMVWCICCWLISWPAADSFKYEKSDLDWMKLKLHDFGCAVCGFTLGLSLYYFDNSTFTLPETEQDLLHVNALRSEEGGKMSWRYLLKLPPTHLIRTQMVPSLPLQFLSNPQYFTSPVPAPCNTSVQHCLRD